MATTRKRSTTSAAVSKSAIEQASMMLLKLPEKPRDNWSLREAVDLLQDAILTALNRGYSYEEVAVLLKQKGMDIAVPSLKRYLATVKREKGITKRRGGKRTQASSTGQSATSTEAASNVAEVSAPTSTTGKRQTKTAIPETTAKPAAKPAHAKAAPKAEPKVAAKKTTAKPTTRAKAPARSTTSRKKA